LKYKVFDNFLEKNDFLAIKSTILSNSFPWYVNGVVDDYDKEKYNKNEHNELFNIHMTHLFYRDHKVLSGYYECLSPIIEKINPKALIRIQANLNIVQKEKVVHGYHIDYEDCTSAIFYLNSNNGSTLFKNGTEIEPIENRIIFFDSNNLHTGLSCTNEKYKCIINFCYVEEKNEKNSVL
jgi:hypothetical protein